MRLCGSEHCVDHRLTLCGQHALKACSNHNRGLGPERAEFGDDGRDCRWRGADYRELGRARERLHIGDRGNARNLCVMRIYWNH